jgi:formylglycine-generating enzyme required for sulfatase activity
MAIGAWLGCFAACSAKSTEGGPSSSDNSSNDDASSGNSSGNAADDEDVDGNGGDDTLGKAECALSDTCDDATNPNVADDVGPDDVAPMLPNCEDPDGDQYGDGPGCLGVDCDPFDATRHNTCTDADPEVSVDVTPSEFPNDGSVVVLIAATVVSPLGAEALVGGVAAVIVDLTPVNQPKTVALLDDGAGGDAVAGDGIFSLQLLVDDDGVVGEHQLVVTATDNTGNVGHGGATVTVIDEDCVPDCEGKHCGENGCGATCGECPLGTLCGKAQVCESADEGEEGRMVFIPGGTFMMGHAISFGPVHEMTVADFWMDQTEVTLTAYTKCVDVDACTVAAGLRWTAEPDYPIHGVNLDQAMAYCEWVGKRLPTEPEWEYAAGGRQGYTYPWGGDELCGGGCQCVTSQGPKVPPYNRVCTVGDYPVGANDLFDMLGNVLEWTSTPDCEYSDVSDTGYDENDCDRAGGFIMRGHGYVQHRLSMRPIVANPDMYSGFRCTWSAP